MRIAVSALNAETEDGFEKAGIARYILNVVEAMARSSPGDTFDVHVKPNFRQPAEWAELSNVHLRPVRRVRLFRYLAGLRSWLQGVDVWFITSNETVLLCPVPRVAMVHDLFPLSHPEWFTDEQRDPMAREIIRTCRSSNVLLTNSESTRNRISLQFGVPKDRIAVTPLGLGNVAPALARSRPANGRYILALGTLEPRKNLKRLVEAFDAISSEFPDVGLSIAGAKGWEFDPVLHVVEQLGLKDRVKFLGYVPDSQIPALFSECEFFAMPSLNEGFGMPVLEAMHYGAPVACSHAGALPEVAGEAGAYFDPESVADMAKVFRELLSDAARREHMAAVGRQRASDFTWERTACLTINGLKKARDRA